MANTGWSRAAGWKMVGAGAAVAGLGAVGLAGLAGDNGDRPERIVLTERAAVQSVAPPPAVAGQPASLSPDGESLDSPFQSVDDSPDSFDSVDTPNQMDIFGANTFESSDSDSFDSPSYESASFGSPS